MDALELCDGSDFNGATCASLGFSSGTLSCTSNCMRNFVSCQAVDRPLADAIDPNLVRWDEPSGSLASWPRTSEIVQAQFGSGQIVVVRDLMNNWPPVQESGWSKPSLGNWWLIARMSDGLWHGATLEWLGVGKTSMNRPRFDGTDDLHGMMGNWRPVSGELVYLLQSTHGRSGVIRGNRQRTNIVRVFVP